MFIRNYTVHIKNKRRKHHDTHLRKTYENRLQIVRNTALNHEEKAELIQKIDEAIYTLYGVDGAIIQRNYLISQDNNEDGTFEINETIGATPDFGKVLQEMGVTGFSYSERSTDTTDFIINILKYYKVIGSREFEDGVTAITFYIK